MHLICFLKTFDYLGQSNVTLSFLGRNYTCSRFSLMFFKIVNKYLKRVSTDHWITLKYNSDTLFKPFRDFVTFFHAFRRSCDPYLCFQGSWNKIYLRNITSYSLVHLICWLNEKEEDSTLSSNISMLKVQNVNTKQPTICLGVEKYQVI